MVHSHNYSVKQQFQRNFDLAVSQTAHPEIFEQVSSEAEGMRLVKNTMGYLCKIHKPYLIWKLGWQCVGRLFSGKTLSEAWQKADLEVYHESVLLEADMVRKVGSRK